MYGTMVIVSRAAAGPARYSDCAGSSSHAPTHGGACACPARAAAIATATAAVAMTLGMFVSERAARGHARSRYHADGGRRKPLRERSLAQHLLSSVLYD